MGAHTVGDGGAPESSESLASTTHVAQETDAVQEPNSVIPGHDVEVGEGSNDRDKEKVQCVWDNDMVCDPFMSEVDNHNPLETENPAHVDLHEEVIPCVAEQMENVRILPSEGPLEHVEIAKDASGVMATDTYVIVDQPMVVG